MFVFLSVLTILPFIKSEICCTENRLTILDCQKKQLKSIPICSNQNHITTFNLAFNEIIHVQNLSFQLYSKLSELKLNNNEIENIESRAFEGLKLLSKLFLNNNYLHTLPIKLFIDLKSLSVIYLHHNKFITIPEVSSPSISNLLLQHNQIQSLYFPNSFNLCKKLKRIDLRYNFITNPKKIQLINLKNMELNSILLKGNKLENITSNILYYIRRFIRLLDISNNPNLTDESFKHIMDSFDHVRHKNKWHLEIFASKIGLTKLTQSTFKSLTNVSLIKLDLSNNFIYLLSTKFETLEDLLELNMDNNRIDQIVNDQFFGLSKLRILKLNNNFINKISINGFYNLQKLTILELSNNNIFYLDTLIFNNLITLKKLSLQGNNIMILTSCYDKPFITNFHSNWITNKIIMNKDLQNKSICFSNSSCQQLLKYNINFKFQLDIYPNYCTGINNKIINENTSFNSSKSNKNVLYLQVRNESRNSLNVVSSIIGVSVIIFLIISIAFIIKYRKYIKFIWSKKMKKRRSKCMKKKSLDSTNVYDSLPDDNHIITEFDKLQINVVN